MSKTAETPEARAENASSLRSAVAEEGTRPFVLFNSELPDPAHSEVRRIVGPRLPNGLSNFTTLRTTMRAIDDVGLPIDEVNRKAFLEGKPVYFVQHMVEVMPERAQGRQTIEGFEASTRTALYVNVALSVERLRACDDRREKKFDRDLRRGYIFERIAKDVSFGRFQAEDQGKPGRPTFALIRALRSRVFGNGDKAKKLKQEKREVSFTTNAFREGQPLLGTHYPGRRPRDVMAEAYSSVFDLGWASAVDFDRIEQAERERLRILSWLHLRAQEVTRAQHEMSASRRSDASMTRFQHHVLANTFRDGPTLDALMDAAIHGDLNPAPLVLNFGSWATEFAIAQRLGRMSRKIAVTLEPMHCERLARMMSAAAKPGDPADAEHLAASKVWKFALAIEGEGFWVSIIESARLTGVAQEITPYGA